MFNLFEPFFQWMKPVFGLYFGGGKDSGPSYEDMLAKYGYQPQYTGKTEASLYDLFQRLTGQGTYSGTGTGDLNAIPFDLGKDTTGLYDATTRGIKEAYLGTPGGPEAGRLADLRAYYNNLNIPEAAINAERLGNQDLNNSLIDQAALLNDNTKNRLSNLLGVGYTGGQNLYSQNLNQQRANMSFAGNDVALQDAISQGNQNNLASLLAGAGTLGVGIATGNPMLTASGGLMTYNNTVGAKNKKSSDSTAKLI
jgi:hypothetical protein